MVISAQELYRHRSGLA